MSTDPIVSDGLRWSVRRVGSGVRSDVDFVDLFIKLLFHIRTYR